MGSEGQAACTTHPAAGAQLSGSRAVMQQLHVVQSSLNENWTHNRHRQCFNFSMSQHSPKLRNGDGFYSVWREVLFLLYAHIQTVALLSLPPHLPPPKDFKHFMKTIFSHPNCYLSAVFSPSSPLPFPRFCSQSGQSQLLHVCDVSDIPAVGIAEPAAGKVLGTPCCAARIWAALQAHSTPPSAFTVLI